MKAVEARWVRLTLALTAFVPLVVMLAPALSRYIDGVWLVCAMYLWPATGVASLVGVQTPGWQWTVIAALYCSIIAVLIDGAVSRLGKVREAMPRRRAALTILIVWLPIAAFLGYRVLEYKGLLTRPTACPGSLPLLADYCGDVSDLRAYVLGGFVDRWYLARFFTRPGALAAIAARGGLVEIPVATIPPSVLDQPPGWWHPPVDATTRVYATAGFPYEGRGPDGDHYLFIEHGQTNRVYVMFKSNF